MLINTSSLDSLRKGFSTAFANGLGQAENTYDRIATTVPSSTSENKYGWLGKMPNMREWIGPRSVENIAEHDYAIKNKKFELTLGVASDDIQDDNLGVYAPLFTEMGAATAAHPNMLVYAALSAGFSTLCYDGQNFFDTDHPVLDANKNEISVANTDGGGGTPWFLLSTKRSLKPLLYQERQKAVFTARDRLDDSNVFNLDEYHYGVKSRCNVGYGFWQMAWGSKQTLNKANYAIGRQGLMGMKGDYDRPLGIMPDLLVVPPSLEGQALEILNAERDAAGATNVYKGTAELLVSPWLA
ncbi:MAG: Mu-like prophage major head subunit gpT family protein [Rhizobiaceae bacterium]